MMIYIVANDVLTNLQTLYMWLTATNTLSCSFLSGAVRSTWLISINPSIPNISYPKTLSDSEAAGRFEKWGQRAGDWGKGATEVPFTVRDAGARPPEKMLANCDLKCAY